MQLETPRRGIYRLKRHSSGVALITILLIVVIATVLGVTMTNEQHFAISRAQTFFDQTVVRQYALGGEELARQILHKDFVEAPETDHLGEAWAAPDMRFEFEEGEIELKIEDLQGRINVNTLLQQGEAVRVAKSRLTALFSEQGLDPVFVDRIQDWIDENNGASGFGAEDFDYLGLDRPYRTANQPMLDTSEVRLILDMENELYQQILPFIAALPDINSEINVNTAPPQVLVTVAPGLSLGAAEGIAADRDGGLPFDTVEDFFANQNQNETSANNDLTGLSVQSSFFQVSVRARYQDRFGYLTSVIQRDPTDGTIRVIYRDHSQKILPFINEETDAVTGQGAAFDG